jgi:catalase
MNHDVMVVFIITGGAPNYFPNSFSGPQDDPKGSEMCPFSISGECKRYNSADEDNFSQVNIFWNKV